MSEENKVDSGEILKTLVKQGAFKAAKEYVAFLENEVKVKALLSIGPEAPESPVESSVES